MTHPRQACLCECLQRPQSSWQQTIASTGSAFDRVGLIDHLLARMLARLRIFIHDVPTSLGISPLTRRLGGDHAYMMEPVFFMRLLHSSYRTTRPEEATLFFVPAFSASCRYTHIVPSQKKTKSVVTCAEEMKRAVKHVAESPFFGARNGSDHMWISAHDH
eukprot:179913-Prymnesium_polylepis.1